MTTVRSARRPQSGEIAAFLERLKTEHPAVTAGHGRLIFALDATASREPSWDHACRIQGEMFETTAALGGLKLQLVFFRGFNECKASRWVNSAADLHRIMRSVRCAGGETQIERVLEHAIREGEKAPIGALVFIGDCMEERADRLCRLATKLGSLNVPVFVFHEGYDPEAEGCFREIARASNGAYLAFDRTGIARLKELLGAIAVYVTGGHAALEAYGAKKGGEVLRLTAQLHR